MKRFSIYFTSILLALALCACGGASPAGPKETVRIGALKGATTIGLVKYMDDEAGKASNVSFQVVTTDEIVPMLIRGEVDMAAIPSNLAAILYHNTNGAIRVVAVNTLGLTYIVETGEEIQSIEDLRGKTVIATGKGAAPEITLRHILTQNGIDPDRDVTLEFRSEPGEIVAWLKQSGGVAMLQQPFVTTAMGSVEGLREAIDLTAEWDKLGAPGTLVIGVFVARADFLERTEDVSAVLARYRASVEWVNAHPAEAAPLVEELGIAPAGAAERAIPKCNVTFIEGAGMKQLLETYYSVLFEAAPESIGGELPGDSLYYVP